MSPAITASPPEVLAHILAALDSFTSLRALLLTSRRFSLAWQAMESSISTSILSRSIPCLEDAQELAEMQEQDEGSPLMTRTARLVVNARSASQACNLFIASVVVPNMLSRQEPPHLSETERLRFHNAFYRLWLLVCFVAESSSPGAKQTASDLQSYLAETNLREMQCLHELALWQLAYCEANYRGQVEQVMATTSMFSSADAEGICTDAYMQIDTVWREKLERVTGVSGVILPDRAPLGFFSMFDEWQEYVEVIPDRA